MTNTLIVTEKRDQAEKLASAMGWTKGSSCYSGNFNNEHVTVVWASGHLITLKSPDEIDTTLSWQDKPSKLLPIPKTYPLKVIETPKHLPRPIHADFLLENIGKYIKKADKFIIATDSDREGEAIGRRVIEHFEFKGTVKRAWFAAGLDKKSLQQAMSNLKGEFDTIGWFRAAEARGRSDWAYQYLVRAYTFYAKYGKFGTYLSQGQGSAGIMSVGRLQTVIVAMIVRRDQDIKEFISKEYYNINALFDFKNNNIETSFNPLVTEETISRAPEGVTWEPQKPSGDNVPLDKPLFTDKAIAEKFKKTLFENKDKAFISSYKEINEKESPPNTFSLTDGQVAIGKALGVDGNLVQIILEDLYEQGWTSYARTSKSELPMNVYTEASERNSLLKSIAQVQGLSAIVSKAKDIHDGNDPVIAKFTPKVFVRKEMEHHGIMPTHQIMTPPLFQSLSPRKKDKGNKVRHTAKHMQDAYEIIAKQFIQAFYPPAIYAAQHIKISVPVVDLLGNKESVFKAKGRRLVDEGWKGLFKVNSSTKDKIFPKFELNESGELTEVNLKKGRTKPPIRYNEVTMSKELENVGKDVPDPKLRKKLKDAEGIGRPATRKSAIETIVGRGYVEVKKSEFYSTRRGQDLIKYIPKWLTTPVVSAEWEDYMTKICDQKDDTVAVQMRDKFVSMQLERVEHLIGYMNDKFLGDLGERVRTAAKVVTPNMKKAIKNIAEAKGIKIPRGTLTDPLMAQEFFNDNQQNSAGQSSSQNSGQSKRAPSPAQVGLINAIKKSLPSNVEFDEAVMSDISKASKFIKSNNKYMPPTAKMLSYLESIIAKLPSGTIVPDDVRLYSSSASDFINKNKG
jgi:DNA topoisomerase-3